MLQNMINSFYEFMTVFFQRAKQVPIFYLFVAVIMLYVFKQRGAKLKLGNIFEAKA